MALCHSPGVRPKTWAGSVVGKGQIQSEEQPSHLPLSPQTHLYGLLTELGNQIRSTAQGT